MRNFRRGGMAAFPARRKMLPAHQPWNCASPPVGFRNPASPPPQHAGTIGPDCPGPGPQTRGIPAPSGRPLEAPPRAICTPGRAICLTGTAAALREFRLEAERATRQTGQTGQTEGHDDVRLAENCAHLAAWGVRHRPGRSGRTGIGRSPLPLRTGRFRPGGVGDPHRRAAAGVSVRHDTAGCGCDPARLRRWFRRPGHHVHGYAAQQGDGASAAPAVTVAPARWSGEIDREAGQVHQGAMP